MCDVRALAIAALLSGGCHSTSHPATPLAAGLQPYAFYVGTWQCKGEEYDAAGKVAATDDKLVVRVTPEITNWLRIVVLQKGEPVTSELLGWDPATQWFHHLWTGADGTSGSLTAQGGWHDGSLVFDEDHPGDKSRDRMTMTKIDADHYTHLSETDTGSGFKKDYFKQCARVAEPYR